MQISNIVVHATDVYLLSVCLFFAQVMQLAGLEGQQVVLLLEDYQFVHPAFLEMVNSLLSSGVCLGLLVYHYFYNSNSDFVDFMTELQKCGIIYIKTNRFEIYM